jgi:hypothetical protein
VRRLAYEAADSGLLSSELAAGIHRVKDVRKLGSRLGNWLTAGEAAALWQVPDRQTLTGKRNRTILVILLGCGLRRRELAELPGTFTPTWPSPIDTAEVRLQRLESSGQRVHDSSGSGTQGHRYQGELCTSGLGQNRSWL